ncbi:hypothetical protein [Rhodococcoides kyotonense]|uniref:Uncharacterized protein n=1 Tax=Rhodococcoides kyotonense TaxID=398843 RepID=A0A239NGN0_9NOCA|nr:hypothetical protein [Rhodococcus kyotonensis]SNT53269.1 hypothetical protein SAMN05421642_1384 [Rhodococcus kyotonensis]
MTRAILHLFRSSVAPNALDWAIEAATLDMVAAKTIGDHRTAVSRARDRSLCTEIRILWP